MTGTLNLREACLDCNVKRFVYASSCAVYGNPVMLPISEGHPKEPLSPYGVSKLYAEAYCLSFYKVYGLETVILRYFNVYGPRQAYNPYSGEITVFIRRLLEGKPPIIFGDGNQTRDFIYVEDVAEANLLALKCGNAVGKPINIGTGEALRIRDLAYTLMELMNVRLEPVYEKGREGDIGFSYADASKAAEILGFRAKTPLRTGFKKIVETI